MGLGADEIGGYRSSDEILIGYNNGDGISSSLDIWPCKTHKIHFSLLYNANMS